MGGGVKIFKIKKVGDFSNFGPKSSHVQGVILKIILAPFFFIEKSYSLEPIFYAFTPVPIDSASTQRGPNAQVYIGPKLMVWAFTWQ